VAHHLIEEVKTMFTDRVHAGRLLAGELRRLEPLDPIVLGLPRGGVPVAAEVARMLHAPLDVVVVRKLGVPGHSEFAMGALGEDDVRFVDWEVVSRLGITATQLSAVVDREQLELERRAREFRAGRPRLDLGGRTVIIVDDGVATGSTVVAAIRVCRDLGAGRVIVATPVAPVEAIRWLGQVADEVVVLESPEPFYAVGQAYVDFGQTTDSEVISILDAHATCQRRPLPLPA
jgi:predicted phosphoribosyltransferase